MTVFKKDGRSMIKILLHLAGYVSVSLFSPSGNEY